MTEADKKRWFMRWMTPATLVFAVVLWISSGVHVAVWSALGVLAWLQSETTMELPEAQIEIQVEGADPVDDESENPTPSDVNAATVQRTDPVREEQQQARRTERHEQPRAEQQVPAEERRVIATPMRPEDRVHRQAITQRSQDPNIEPPPDARYIARENQRVEEETAASIRNYRDDQQVVQAGRPHRSEEEAPGQDDEQESADLRNREGDEETHLAAPTPRTSEPPPPQTAPSNSPPPGSLTHEGAQATAPRSDFEAVIHDPAGSFTLGRTGPRREGLAAERENAGTGRGAQGQGNDARTGLRGGRGNLAPPMGLSWETFEQSVGSEELARDRERYAEERRSRARGSNREREWRQFRAALENFVPHVRPGNQTALNAAASPYADYLSEVHRRMHRYFVDRFIASLPSGASSPYADRSLMAKLEIIMNKDGSVHRVGIVRSSGLVTFDHGAWSSVYRGAPYPAAPDAILSGDGRAYFHWGFYRNERHCSTENAEPFILPHPPNSPARSPSPLRDVPDYGGVLQNGAPPAPTNHPDPPADRDDEERPREEPATPPSENRRSPGSPPPQNIPGGVIGKK